MSGRRCRVTLAGMIWLGAAVAGTGIELATDGRTEYAIVVAADAPVPDRAGATELAAFLEQVTGAPFPVLSETDAGTTAKAILVGRSAAVDALDLGVDWDSLAADGFILRTVGPRLVIAGTRSATDRPARGTINGVYTFLEDVIGCRWYTPSFSVIPSRPTLALADLTQRFVPAFEARSIHCAGAADPAWAARNRLNLFTRDVGSVLGPDGEAVEWSTFISDPRLAGAWRYARWHVHTLGHNSLLPYAKFEEHPEYFALIDEKRLATSQPCMTNPNLARFIGEQAATWCRSDPDASIVSISQGDFSKTCQCEACREAYDKTGLTGLYMRFVNDAAVELERTFPGMLVDTLAYQWTRKVPAGLHLNRNVVIRYAPIEACCSHAFDDCGWNRKLSVIGELAKWAGIAPRVWIWYYAIPRTELHPYPNLRCLRRNFQLMRDAGATGFFIQAEEGRICMTGGLTELQAYLFAQLMWDPDYDVDAGIREFAQACYGAAAPNVRAYIDAVNDPETYTGTPANYTYLREFPGLHAACMVNLPLKPAKLAELDRLFDEAEAAVAGDAEVLQRVRLVRLSLQYALILYAQPEDSARERALSTFFERAAAAGVATVRNPKTDREEPIEEFRINFVGTAAD